MAQYNLGRFLPIFRGNYSSTTTYQPLDIVYYLGSSYVAKQTTTNHAPTASAYWQIVALKGELSPTLTPEQTESIIAQIESETSWVTDPDYVHCDNNFTNEMKSAVEGIGSGTLTINRNGVQVGSIDMNAQEDTDINIVVPTRISDLSGNEEYVHIPEVEGSETTGDIVIDILESNKVYVFSQPIESITIDAVDYDISDIKQRWQSQQTIIEFATSASFTEFNLAESGLNKYEGEELEPESKYVAEIKGGYVKFLKIQ